MQQEELKILNIYAPNVGAPRYIKQIPNNLQRDLDSHKIIVGDFNTPLSILERPMRQIINKGYPGLALRSGLTRPNGHLQNYPPQIHRIYILSTTS